VRQFDSPVKPLSSQLGALVVPLSTPVRTTTVDPVLKTAWPPPPGGRRVISRATPSTAKAHTASGNNYFPDLGSQWQEAEFNVFGDAPHGWR
jgi:hypothetical protein